VTLLLGAFFRLIGVDLASSLAGNFTRAIGPMLGAISDRARTNLSIAFPDWLPDQIEMTTRAVWENLGRTTAEFAHLTAFNPDCVRSRVEIEGRERLDEIKAAGKPVIFVSGHLANWEVMSIALHAAGIDYLTVYRAANNPLVDGLIIRERAKVMSRRLAPKGKRGGRDMIEAIKAGASIAMLVDQKLTSGGIPSPFFGKEAMTAPAAARLSLKYGAPVVPVSVVRTTGAHFKLKIHGALAFSPSGDAAADTQALTDQINLIIEEMIRTNPGQWLWLHRRWPKEIYKKV
jgi:KDO2-lipid IV(A) lauroyltransferase